MSNLHYPNIDLSNVKGALIDLDNTLYLYEPNHQAALSACYDHYQGPLSFNTFCQHYRRHRLKVTEQLSPQGACRSRLMAFQGMFEELDGKHSFLKALDFERCYWQSFIDHMSLEPSAKAFLENCYAHQIKLCIVSDMTAEIQIRKLAKLGLTDKIDFLVTSEEVGSEKPHASMFQRALQKLNMSPEEVIMVGDNKEKDILGAQQLGIQSYLVEAPRG